MDLEALKSARELVSIDRPAIDLFKLSGFILDYSEKLIALQYEFDFILDGLLFIRRDDVESIISTETDRYQTEILRREGQVEKINFEPRLPITDWPSLLGYVRVNYKFAIVESEARKRPKFVLGPITKVGKRVVRVHGVNGTGRWHEEDTRIPYAKITSVRVGTHYVSAYERNVPFEP